VLSAAAISCGLSPAIGCTLAIVHATSRAQEHGVIPGSGERLTKVCDVFEDE